MAKPRMIFISLPVGNVARATAFYEAIGATKNPQFSDDTASCMVISDTIHVMLMAHDKFQHFTPKTIADPRTSNQVLLCLSADSRAEVDDMVTSACNAGARPDPSPIDDYDFMFGRSFEDLDGHIWGVTWVDVDAMAKAQSKAHSTAQAAAANA